MVREGVEDIGDENEISVWIHAAPQVPGSQGESGAVRGSQGQSGGVRGQYSSTHWEWGDSRMGVDMQEGGVGLDPGGGDPGGGDPGGGGPMSKLKSRRSELKLLSRTGFLCTWLPKVANFPHPRI